MIVLLGPVPVAELTYETPAGSCTRAAATCPRPPSRARTTGKYTGWGDAVPVYVTFIKGSIQNELLLEKLFTEYEPAYVFHFAALPRVAFSLEFPVRTSEVNVLGTVNLLAEEHHFTAQKLAAYAALIARDRAALLVAMAHL